MYLISGNITSNVTGNLLVITGNGNIGNITSNFRTLVVRVFRASDSLWTLLQLNSTQLNCQLSWVELSRVGRSEQGLTLCSAHLTTVLLEKAVDVSRAAVPSLIDKIYIPSVTDEVRASAVTPRLSL